MVLLRLKYIDKNRFHLFKFWNYLPESEIKDRSRPIKAKLLSFFWVAQLVFEWTLLHLKKMEYDNPLLCFKTLLSVRNFTFKWSMFCLKRSKILYNLELMEKNLFRTTILRIPFQVVLTPLFCQFYDCTRKLKTL